MIGEALAPLTVSGDVTVRTNAMLFLNQPSTVSNDVIVLGGGTLTHTNNATSELYKLNLTVAGNLDVDVGGSIDVSYRGYGGGQGPGPAGYAGWDSGGASYGGQGAGVVNGAPTYGSIVAPTNLGSGAQSGSGILGGGGAVILNVAGSLTLNGQMLANGGARDGNYSAAGGTLFLTVGRMTGVGALRANGGTANNGGGGGGRIAVVLTNPAASFPEFTGSLLATGQGAGAGGAGTIYLRAPGQATNEGTLIVDNGGIGSTYGALISTGVTDTVVGNVLIRNNGVLALAQNQSLTVQNIWSNSATLSATTGASIVFAGSGTSTATIYGASSFGRLTCATPGKTLKFAGGSSNSVREALTLTGAVGSNIILRSTSDGVQWKLNVAAAAGQSVSWVDVKDSDARPGSSVSATFSTDSLNNSNWVFVVTGQTNRWTGSNSVAWGNGANWSLGRMPTLVDDQAVIPAGCSNYPSLDASRQVNELNVASGASLNLNGYDFTVYGNATWSGGVSAVSAERLMFVGGAVDFTGGGVITAANSTVVIGGAGAQAVNLAGKTFFNIGVTNGSGVVTLNGGCTARQLLLDAGTNPLSVNFESGVSFNVRDFLVQGSAASTNITLRSTGGSAWRLNVTGYSRVTGVDVKDSDASGGKTVYPLGWKDSGGNTNWGFSSPWSIWLGTTSTNFATAANWSPAGVPGTGSLILVESTNLLVIGSATSVKGLLLGGGTGVVQVQVFAPLTVSGDVTLRTNATLSINQPMTVSNDVLVLPGGLLTHTANPVGQTEVYKLNLMAGNLTLDAGSSINVSYRGFAATYGPGGETSDNSCGASYGGLGRPGSTTNWVTYGSICAPTNLGSGGYAGSGFTAGGGAAILNITAITLLNGSLLANGGPRDGYNTASGGSIFLTTGRLLGSGPIQAQGGLAGATGGGGGRIALVLTNAAGSFVEYTGAVTASGQGTAAGGAGTIYLAGPSQVANNRGDVIINNGGQSGSSPGLKLSL